MTEQLDWLPRAPVQPQRHVPVREHVRTLPAITAEQSKRKRERGMARVKRAADEALPGWTRQAAEYLCWYAIEIAHGQPFVLEDAREISGQHIPRPPNPKAWGPAAKLAQRKGMIALAGYAPTRSSNGSPKRLWIAQ